MADWRFLAVRALTGEVLDWNLPLRDVEFTRTLSAAPSLRANIDPANKADILTAIHTDGLPILDMWSTAIFAEDPSGTLRFGGLLVQPTRQGSTFGVECTGYFGWLARQLYLGDPLRYFQEHIDPEFGKGDPLGDPGIVRRLVGHAQSASDADLGIVVDGATSSPIEVGGVEPNEAYKITPWEHPNIGQAISQLASEQPGFDFIESHEWANPDDPDSTDIRHRLTLHYPRAGRRRTDIRFETGVNISADEPEVADGDEYANVVVADGAGEGSAALRETFPRRDGRPRVMAEVDAQHMTSSTQLRAFARARATAKATMVRIPSIQVIDHPSAPLGSWGIGDDVFVVVETGWGRVESWQRITEDSWSPDAPNVATLTLEPAESFLYGGTDG